MKPFVTVPAAFAAVLCDLALAPGAEVLGVRPSITLVLVVLWSTLRPLNEAMLLAPVCGLLLGLLGSEPLGVSVLALAPLVLLGGVIAARGPERRVFATAGLVVIGTFIYLLLSFVLNRVAGGAVAAGSGTPHLVLAVTAVNLLVAAVLYLPIAWTSDARAVRRQFRRL